MSEFFFKIWHHENKHHVQQDVMAVWGVSPFSLHIAMFQLPAISLTHHSWPPWGVARIANGQHINPNVHLLYLKLTNASCASNAWADDGGVVNAELLAVAVVCRKLLPCALGTLFALRLVCTDMHRTSAQ